MLDRSPFISSAEEVTAVLMQADKIMATIQAKCIKLI
jgi:hypothetical protein